MCKNIRPLPEEVEWNTVLSAYKRNIGCVRKGHVWRERYRRVRAKEDNADSPREITRRASATANDFGWLLNSRAPD